MLKKKDKEMRLNHHLAKVTPSGEITGFLE
jgi:hypothetical protein